MKFRRKLNKIVLLTATTLIYPLCETTDAILYVSFCATDVCHVISQEPSQLFFVVVLNVRVHLKWNETIHKTLVCTIQDEK